MAERHPAYDGFISIHALREESDKFEGDDHGIDAKISIHALREEGDPACRFWSWGFCAFNPRPPRGGRLQASLRDFMREAISIHALREEGDRCKLRRNLAADISIHALREESDSTCKIFLEDNPYFNPRPPRGERLLGLVGLVGASCISIHALREESDVRECFPEKE